MQKRKITYKLYPSDQQKDVLFEHLRLHRHLYNAALEERISAYQKYKLSLQYND